MPSVVSTRARRELNRSVSGSEAEMIRINAIVAGPHAPRDRFSGQVHSVFRHACNVMLADGDMLSLLSRDMGCVPHGVRLATPSGFSFLDQVRTGQTVGCRAGVLRFQGGTLEANLSTAQIWRSGDGLKSIDWAKRNIQRAWQTALEVLQQAQATGEEDRDGTAQYLSGEAASDVHRLTHAMRLYRLMEATRIAEGMVGCGRGLTPSGDDCLVGYLAGLDSTIQSERQQTARSALAWAIRRRAHMTSDISRIYLRQACAGHFSEPLVSLLATISQGQFTEEIRRQTMRALDVGASSGREGVLGCLLGLITWCEVLPPEAHQWFVGQTSPSECML